jgi:hypothetical protein
MYFFLSLVWLIIVIIYAPRFYLAIVVLINSLFDGKKMTIQEAYSTTKGKYWPILGSLLLIGIMTSVIGIFFLITNISFSFDFIIQGILAAFILSLYYLISPVVALEAKKRGYLRRSREMIEGNYGVILLLYLLTTTLLNQFYGYILFIIENDFVGRLGLLIIYHFIFFFVFPFAETVKVIVYRKLVRVKGHPATQPSEGISYAETTPMEVSSPDRIGEIGLETPLNKESIQELNFILKTEFKSYANEEVNAYLLEDIFNSGYYAGGFMVLEPNKQIHGSNFMQVDYIVAEEAGYVYIIQINLGDVKAGFKQYILATVDKNIVLKHMIAYLEDQVIPDISSWEDISDQLQN